MPLLLILIEVALNSFSLQVNHAFEPKLFYINGILNVNFSFKINGSPYLNQYTFISVNNLSMGQPILQYEKALKMHFCKVKFKKFLNPWY